MLFSYNWLQSFFEKENILSKRLTYPDYDDRIGGMIHEYLHKEFDLKVEMQFLLYAANIIKDNEKIRELLSHDIHVVADRYITSTIVYQGTRGFPITRGLAFTKMFDVPKPDIIIYLDVKPETSIKRKIKEKKELDRNEVNEKFLGDVSKTYLKAARRNLLSKWVVIDGEKKKDDVFKEILNVLHENKIIK